MKAVLCGGRVCLFIISFICLFLAVWVFVAVQAFFSCGDRGLVSSCRARVSHCSGFSCFQEPLCSTQGLPGPGIEP